MSNPERLLINSLALRNLVDVHLKPPPCAYEFRVILDAGGFLRSVCIDGVWYAARKMKTSPRFNGEHEMVSMVEVVIRNPDIEV